MKRCFLLSQCQRDVAILFCLCQLVHLSNWEEDLIWKQKWNFLRIFSTCLWETSGVFHNSNKTLPIFSLSSTGRLIKARAISQLISSRWKGISWDSVRSPSFHYKLGISSKIWLQGNPEKPVVQICNCVKMDPLENKLWNIDENSWSNN